MVNYASFLVALAGTAAVAGLPQPVRVIARHHKPTSNSLAANSTASKSSGALPPLAMHYQPNGLPGKDAAALAESNTLIAADSFRLRGKGRGRGKGGNKGGNAGGNAGNAGAGNNGGNAGNNGGNAGNTGNNGGNAGNNNNGGNAGNNNNGGGANQAVGVDTGIKDTIEVCTTPDGKTNCFTILGNSKGSCFSIPPPIANNVQFFLPAANDTCTLFKDLDCTQGAEAAAGVIKDTKQIAWACNPTANATATAGAGAGAAAGAGAGAGAAAGAGGGQAGNGNNAGNANNGQGNNGQAGNGNNGGNANNGQNGGKNGQNGGKNGQGKNGQGNNGKNGQGQNGQNGQQGNGQGATSGLSNNNNGGNNGQNNNNGQGQNIGNNPAAANGQKDSGIANTVLICTGNNAKSGCFNILGDIKGHCFTIPPPLDGNIGFFLPPINGTCLLFTDEDCTAQQTTGFGGINNKAQLAWSCTDATAAAAAAPPAAATPPPANNGGNNNANNGQNGGNNGQNGGNNNANNGGKNQQGNNGQNNNGNNGQQSGAAKNVSFGKCSTPEIKFAKGLPGRGKNELAFEAVDQKSFPHGAALGIDVIADSICQGLINNCGQKQNSDSVQLCRRAENAANSATKGGAQADAFNKVMGFQTNFAAVH